MKEQKVNFRLCAGCLCDLLTDNIIDRNPWIVRESGGQCTPAEGGSADLAHTR